VVALKKSYVFILQKFGWVTFWATFFHEFIWSPCWTLTKNHFTPPCTQITSAIKAGFKPEQFLKYFQDDCTYKIPLVRSGANVMATIFKDLDIVWRKIWPVFRNADVMMNFGQKMTVHTYFVQFCTFLSNPILDENFKNQTIKTPKLASV
jgi:hypothetical protein